MDAPAPLELVRLERRGPIGIVWIDHPPVNVLSSAVLRQLMDRFAEAGSDPDIRAVILAGAAEKAFAAGADIREMAPMGPPEAHVHGARGQGVTRAIERFPLPVIAAVHGVCLGGGCEIAMACDFIIASEDALFGQPEVNLGVMPGWGGTQRLPRLDPAARCPRMDPYGALGPRQRGVRGRTGLSLGRSVRPPSVLDPLCRRARPEVTARAGRGQVRDEPGDSIPSSTVGCPLSSPCGRSCSGPGTRRPGWKRSPRSSLGCRPVATDGPRRHAPSPGDPPAPPDAPAERRRSRPRGRKGHSPRDPTDFPAPRWLSWQSGSLVRSRSRVRTPPAASAPTGPAGGTPRPRAR